jgi:hypothetical protein
MANKKATSCPCIICKSGRCGVCSPRYSFHNQPIAHKLITSEHDIMTLDIINWRGLNGSWRNPGDALRTIASWFINTTHYTITPIDLEQAPHRDDFPGWKHIGDHPRMGHLYWNWFHDNLDGELYFSDSPDFYGTFRNDGGPDAHFYGDIERVSAQAFAITQKRMNFGDIWISVFINKQIIIEPMVDIQERYTELLFGEDMDTSTEEPKIVSKPSQLSLF